MILTGEHRVWSIGGIILTGEKMIEKAIPMPLVPPQIALGSNQSFAIRGQRLTAYHIGVSEVDMPNT